TRCTWRSCRPPRQQERLKRLGRRGELVTLDGAGGVHALRACRRALSYERAGPYPIGGGQHPPPLLRPPLARVPVVVRGPGDGRRAEEAFLEADYRACGIAEHAVDAHAVLLVLVQVGWCLQQLAFWGRRVLVADQPRLDLRQLPHEVTDLDDEIADHGEVAQ